jgi:hypothetical protein
VWYQAEWGYNGNTMGIYVIQGKLSNINLAFEQFLHFACCGLPFCWILLDSSANRAARDEKYSNIP